MKTIFDIMDERDSCLLDFDKACDELVASKYILAEKRISELLQVIARSKKLYELIKGCTDGFDFLTEYNKSKRTENGKPKIVLPSETRKKQIAFVFCLLYSFDAKKIDFQEFVHTYYYSDSPNFEYERFCNEVVLNFRENVGAEFISPEEELPYDPYVVPYSGSDSVSFEDFAREEKFSSAAAASNVQSYAQNIKSSEVNDGFVKNPPVPLGFTSEVAESRDDENCEKRPDVNKNENINFSFGAEGTGEASISAFAATSLSVCVKEIIGVVAREPEIAIADKEELMIAAEAFENAVEFGGLNSIRVMYICLKNTIKRSPLARQLSLQLDSLIDIVKENEII